MRSFICYSNAPLNAKGRPLNNYHSFKANDAFTKHYANMLLLQHIAKTSDNFIERSMAREELDIAERKLAYARNHPNCDIAAACQSAQHLKMLYTPAYCAANDNTLRVAA